MSSKLSRTQGPEEFRVNKWITYLKSQLKNVYTCRLAPLISPMGSLWIYCKRFLRFLSDPDRLCCSPFWKSITGSHILAGARHVARKATEADLPSPQSLGLRSIQCDRNNRFFQRFSTGFDFLTNKSPLDPVSRSAHRPCWLFSIRGQIIMSHCSRIKKKSIIISIVLVNFLTIVPWMYQIPSERLNKHTSTKHYCVRTEKTAIVFYSLRSCGLASSCQKV